MRDIACVLCEAIYLCVLINYNKKTQVLNKFYKICQRLTALVYHSSRITNAQVLLTFVIVYSFSVFVCTYHTYIVHKIF